MTAPRFTELLREAAGPLWPAATGHAFVLDLAADRIDDDSFRRYLVEDFIFIEALVTLLGYAVAKAPDMPRKRRLAGFLAAVTGDETNYFERSLNALGAADAFERPPAPGPVTAALRDLMLRAAADGDYADILAVLVPAEWIYLTWARDAAQGPRPKRFYLDEWITLHAIPEFVDFVEWLRTELDAVAENLSSQRREALRNDFLRVVELEVAFFDAAREQGGGPQSR